MKNLYLGIIMGILIAIIGGLGYELYALGKSVSAYGQIVGSDHSTLSQVVDYLNKAAAQPASPSH